MVLSAWKGLRFIIEIDITLPSSVLLGFTEGMRDLLGENENQSLKKKGGPIGWSEQRGRTLHFTKAHLLAPKAHGRYCSKTRKELTPRAWAPWGSRSRQKLISGLTWKTETPGGRFLGPEAERWNQHKQESLFIKWEYLLPDGTWWRTVWS